MSNLSRATQILEYLVDEPDGIRITDVASRMNLNRAIPFRLLSELVELGYATQDPESEKYRATYAVGSLGLRQLESTGVMDWSQDELAPLAESSGELVRVAIASEHRLRFVAQAQGASSSLIVHSPLRAELALHATASGKAYLATLPTDEADQLIKERGLEGFTPRTITSKSELGKDLRSVRKRGFAVVEEEMELGVCSAAAAITPGPDAERAVGTVSIAGPSVRFTRQRIDEVSETLIKTARRLSQQWNVYSYLNAPTHRAEDA